MIFIASDHGGFGLKEIIKNHLSQKNIEYTDLGTNSTESCDYPDYAKKVALEVVKNNTKGILICGSGVGMSIAANKIKGVRAALCYDNYITEMTRKHNNANIICLGERNITKEKAIELIDVFLSTDFEGGRHQRRVDQIET